MWTVLSSTMFRNEGLEPKGEFYVAEAGRVLGPNQHSSRLRNPRGAGSEVFLQNALEAITRYDTHPKVINQG